MKIRAKILTGYILIVLFIIAVAFFSINSGQRYLMAAAGQNSVFIVTELLKRIGSELDTRLIDIVAYTQRKGLQQLLADSNREFSVLKH